MSIPTNTRKIVLTLGFFFLISSLSFAEDGNELDFEYFMNEVQPIFLAKRDGNVRCIQCHVRASGFRLQPLEDDTFFWNTEQSRMNYAMARAFSVPGADPLKSRLLTHPLATPDAQKPRRGGSGQNGHGSAAAGPCAAPATLAPPGRACQQGG